jgi:hypothetical protein
LFTEKWAECIPYFQFLCLGFGLLLVIHNTNLTALKALGRSDFVLKLELIKKCIGILLLTLGVIKYGIWGILTGLTINSMLELFLNSYYLNKLIGYGIKSQVKDFLPALLISLSIMILTYIFIYQLLNVQNNWILLFIGFITYSLLYIGASMSLNPEAINILLRIIKIK